MKKTLLLLSCCLATWCSVHAGLKSSASSSEVASARTNITMLNSYGQGYGSITSASFDKSNNTMYVSYSVYGASRAELKLMQIRTGNTVATYSLSVNASTTSFRVDPKFDEGKYMLMLYIDGSMFGYKEVNINAYGSIKSITANTSTKNLTVNYSIDHASTYSNTIRVFETNDTGKKNPLMRVELSDPNTYKSKTFSYSTLTKGRKYTFTLYSNDNPLYSMDYTIPTDPIPPLPTGELKSISYAYDNIVKIEYTLKDAYSATVNIYDINSGKLIKDGVTISNSSITQIKSIENVPLESWSMYRVEISAKNRDGKTVTFSKDLRTEDIYNKTAGPGINSLTYENNRVWVNFNLTKCGANVRFELVPANAGHVYPGPSKYYYNYGYCNQSYGSYCINLPSQTGSIVYVVILYEDGRPISSKQIVVTR